MDTQEVKATQEGTQEHTEPQPSEPVPEIKQESPETENASEKPTEAPVAPTQEPASEESPVKPEEVETPKSEEVDVKPEPEETKPEESSPEPTETKVDESSPEPTETKSEEAQVETPKSEVDTKPESSPPDSQPAKVYGGILTEDQLLEAMYLATVYREFWANKKFQEGWDTPVINLKSVEHLLEEAAEIVTELRSKFSQDSSPIDGNAKEYLWSLESLPTSDEFVRGLIHATLQHADGYVSGLDENAVDAEIAQIVEYNNAHQEHATKLSQVFQKGRELESSIKKQWAETTELLNKALEERPSQLWTSSLVAELNQISEAITRVKGQIDCFEARRTFKQHGGLSQSCELGRSKPKLSPSSEGEKTEDPETKQGLLKVETVQKKVANIDSQILNLELGLKSDLQKVSELAQRPKEAMTHITEMKKKAAIYLDELCKDLDSLDTITGEALRPLRKAEVLHIQGLIDHVEKVQDQILMLETEIKPAAEKVAQAEAEAAKQVEVEKAKQAALEKQRQAEEVQKILVSRQQELQRQRARIAKEEEERRKQAAIFRSDRAAAQERNLQERAAQEKVAQQKAAIPVKNVKNSSSDDEEEEPIDFETAWRRMKLEVDLNSKELEDGFVIVGSIPNMNKADITIKINEDKLEIGGFRGPTQAELAQMLRMLQQSRDLQGISQRDKSIALLRMGHGRFGTWSAVYQLPEDVVPEKIQAEYNHGILKVNLPKRQRQIPRQLPRQRSPYPYFEEPQQRPDPRSFYGDPRGPYAAPRRAQYPPGYGGFW